MKARFLYFFLSSCTVSSLHGYALCGEDPARTHRMTNLPLNLDMNFLAMRSSSSPMKISPFLPVTLNPAFSSVWS